MKKTKTITFLLFLFAITGIKAQQSINATGGNGSGAGGTASYSIGQVSYISLNSSNGYINQGVQQPFEFFTLGITENKNISLSYTVYPNPTASTIYLKVEKTSLENLSFQLYDISGKLLINQKITSIETPITMGIYANSNYFLKIIDNNKELQTIKIIKN